MVLRRFVMLLKAVPDQVLLSHISLRPDPVAPDHITGERSFLVHLSHVLRVICLLLKGLRLVLLGQVESTKGGVSVKVALRIRAYGDMDSPRVASA